MPHWNEELSQRTKTPFETKVYYFASTQAELLRTAAKQVRAALLPSQENSDYTRLDGPVPDFGELVSAAGTPSFFGTPRVVELHQIAPASFTDKDITEVGELFGQLQNAVLLVTVLYADGKAAQGKRAQKLMAAAKKHGFAAELLPPTARESLAFVQTAAKQAGANINDDAARLLRERVGDDLPLLQNEVEKLAAMSGYKTIDVGLVQKNSVSNIEANVFELARSITACKRGDAFSKLEMLLEQRTEPIAIAAVLGGNFVDMYRVRCGVEQRLPVGTIFKEMGYKGSDYRLKKAQESAARFSRTQLEKSIFCLAELDKSLKSSALSNKAVLLEAAVGSLLQIGEHK